ncbi:MAG: helix-hairpin-helix domain-containing protein [Candidatus Caenarcaniphilales bacterium]|jgi:competence protein ComEA|nr:helix-hairpin-helix domain-containing protein [Candidatus Caenarcaniphilales bacterium]
MKKLAIAIFVFFAVLSALIYFTKARQYEAYIFEEKSSVVKKYQFNPNLANAREFDNLPGISSKLAQAIINDRAMNGRFNSIDDLMRVKGIGPTKLANIREYLTMQAL